MGFTRDLTDALCRHLADRGIGVFDPNSTPPPGTVAITVGWLPDAGSVVVLDATPFSGSLTSGYASVALRVRCRADAADGGRATDDLVDEVHDALNGLWSRRLDDLHIVGINRSGTGSTDIDGRRRVTRSEPYLVRATRRIQNHH